MTDYRKRKDVKGTVYLLHFERNYKHAAHYLGFAENLENRIEEHAKGRGARLTQVIKQAGIGFQLVKTWANRTRKFERALKNRRQARALCPACRTEFLEKRRLWQIDYRYKKQADKKEKQNQ